ncbi:diphthine--ammonia ligase [Salibacter sp.]|uniref:Dph6-related ATP pyrophosphatase n=1 Tax=Salibacter sp. TaxID=2010995 RepID=UPI0028704CE9|nr:diphthine--ammonia ligase [Salibacter sp.]MDR9398554.1 diphthine--ammonia ligase [Salibacter sp.]MDR9487622.1 diphthine--ammonia ligase [Salibacter sp.]
MTKPKAAIFWSGGKDAAYALQLALEEFDVVELITTVDSNNSVTMHEVPFELIEEQSKSLHPPLCKLDVTEYKNAMRNLAKNLIDRGVEHLIFGDINLEDVRQFRDDIFSEYSITTHYPLWKKDTKELFISMVRSGWRSIPICVETQKVGEDLLGSVLTEKTLTKLPKDVDPCGENGEFHTFVIDGPLFESTVEITTGEKYRKTFEYKTDKGQQMKTGFTFLNISKR